MKRALYTFLVSALLLVGSGPAAGAAPDLATIAAGRIRFVDGPAVRMTLQGTTVTPDLDYLVPVGAAFRTGTSRLELATLNGDLFWFDRGTDFDFEASDPAGPGTTLFLGRGSFVARTSAPFTLITGAGSLLLPAGGTYSVSKAESGKARTVVATVSGPPPAVIKHATMFSKFSMRGGVNESLLAWQAQREADWARTLTRADLFSRVDMLPPMMAYTDAGGEVQWRRVTSARPLAWLSDSLSGNLYVGSFRYPYLRAMGLLPAELLNSTEFVTAVWFLTAHYNSLRWAWDVPNGWHVEWYWNPVAGFGAEFAHPRFYWLTGLPDTWWYWQLWRPPTPPRRDRPPLVFAWGGTRTAIQASLPNRAGGPPKVRLVESARLRERLRTDPGLGSLRRAWRLDARVRAGGAADSGGGRFGSRVATGRVPAHRVIVSPVVRTTPRSSTVVNAER